jgi:hypothetical protein
MLTTSELLIRAKNAIQAGEKSLRSAAEDIAAAQAKGATQREIAAAVGKSLGWVNRLLKWRSEGYKNATPFGPTSRAARQRHRVQATEPTSRKSDVGRSNGDCDEAKGKIAQIVSGRTPKHRAFDANARSRLLRLLGVLGSDLSDERASAALKLERLRSEIGFSWDQQVVPHCSDSDALAA